MTASVLLPVMMVKKYTNDIVIKNQLLWSQSDIVDIGVPDIRDSRIKSSNKGELC